MCDSEQQRDPLQALLPPTICDLAALELAFAEALDGWPDVSKLLEVLCAELDPEIVGSPDQAIAIRPLPSGGVPVTYGPFLFAVDGLMVLEILASTHQAIVFCKDDILPAHFRIDFSSISCMYRFMHYEYYGHGLYHVTLDVHGTEEEK